MYNKKEWVAKEVITKEALNNIENGIAELDKLGEELDGKINNLPYISVKDFGAIGDGETDDTNAIQEALDYAVNTHIVFIPAGVYKISQPLKINMRQQVQGIGERSIIKACAEMEMVLNIYELNSSLSMSFIGIDNIFIDCNNLSNIGIKIATFTNGSYLTNSYIKNAVDTGLYITNSWYAKYDNIQITNCGLGMRIDDYVDAADKHDLVNGVNFNNIFINHCTSYALSIKGRSFGLSFTGCTFENSGTCNVQIESLLSTITFNNCYVEGSNNALICDGGYENGLVGTLNLIGGYYNANDTMVIVGENTPIQQLNIIGAAMCNWNSNAFPDYFVKSYAHYNLFEAHMHGLATIASYYYTGYASGNFFKDYGKKQNYTHSNLRTGYVECVERTAYGEQCDAKFEIGSSLNTSSDTNMPYKYQFKIINNYNKGLQLNQMLNGGGVRPSFIVDHNNVFMPTRLRLPIVKPEAPYVGEIIYDQATKSLMYWNGTDWVNINISE